MVLKPYMMQKRDVEVKYSHHQPMLGVRRGIEMKLLRMKT